MMMSSRGIGKKMGGSGASARQRTQANRLSGMVSPSHQRRGDLGGWRVRGGQSRWETELESYFTKVSGIRS